MKVFHPSATAPTTPSTFSVLAKHSCPLSTSFYVTSKYQIWSSFFSKVRLLMKLQRAIMGDNCSKRQKGLCPCGKLEQMCDFQEPCVIACIFTSCVHVLSVGDFLPPPPPPLDDPGALPSSPGNFPPPPPLDEGAFRAQVRCMVEVISMSRAWKLVNSVIISMVDEHLFRA